MGSPYPFLSLLLQACLLLSWLVKSIIDILFSKGKLERLVEEYPVEKVSASRVYCSKASVFPLSA